jgi:hypothetical protein
MRHWVERYAAALATAAVAAVLGIAARPSDLAPGARQALAATFKFTEYSLNASIQHDNNRRVRSVHPALKHIDAWVSSMGAAVAIADIDGIGQPSDICLVDPRSDTVTIRPAPGTGKVAGKVTRPHPYDSFVIPHHAAGYNPKTFAPMGCLLADVNEDGRIDVVVYYWGRTPVAYLQIGQGRLAAARFLPVEIVPPNRTGDPERWNTSAAVFADIDGDGHPDLLFGNYFRDGDRVLDETATDRVELQRSWSRAANAGQLHLLLWKEASERTVTFVDRSNTFEGLIPMRSMAGTVAGGWTLALGAADLTGDLLPEIYVANDFGSDRLLLNTSIPHQPSFKLVEGVRDFLVPRSNVLGRDSFKGMGVDFADIRGDGRLAIGVSNIAEEYALLENHFLFVHTGDDDAWQRHEAPYRNMSRHYGTSAGGWGWDLKFADLDNSGSQQILQATGFILGDRNRWPELQELAMGNDELLKDPRVWPRFGPSDDISGKGSRDRLYVKGADNRYHDVWVFLGLNDGAGTTSRGIALGDVYGNGRLAVAIARQWMPSVFLRNDSLPQNHWLVLDLRLRGELGDRPAIGAKAKVEIHEDRHVVGYVDGGSGHAGRRAPEIHLGLGPKVPEELKVQLDWLDQAGKRQSRTVYLERSRRHRISLSEANLRPLEVPRRERKP